MKRFVALTVVIFTLTTGIFAQKAQTKRFALVIGNQDYEENPLSNPRADAALMERSLKDCGFDVTLKYDLTYKEMADVFADFASYVYENGNQDSISFIYYSGHGVQINGKNYMVPTDNKNIVDEIKAKSRCKAIDELIELVPSETQIVVLDACRNNPFRETKTKFTKGLTRIVAPKSVPNFLTLFSTGDGQTADDGRGKNSLFTETLARKIKTEMNTQVLVVFNNVADEIKTSTNGKQIPLIAGTSVNIELMNAEIAAAKQAEIQAQLKQLKKDSASLNPVTYETDKNILEAELQIMKEREIAAKRDKREKDEQLRKENAFKAQNQREMERIQKEVERQKKELQQQKAQQKSSIRYVSEIEENKQIIQELRTQIATKIYEANLEVDIALKDKIREIDNRPLGLTETDSNGKITKTAKAKRENEKKELKLKAEKEKNKNYEIFYNTIRDEETQRMNQINKDLDTIKTASYTASSINNEVLFNVSNYDGADCKWIIRYKSNLFEDESLFSSNIDFTYEQLCKLVLHQKYISPVKMNDAQSNSYLETITQYDELIRGDSILYVEVDYKISPVQTAVSEYKITTTKASLYCFDEDGESILISSKKFESERTFRWNTSNKLESLDEILAKIIKAQNRYSDSNKSDIEERIKPKPITKNSKDYDTSVKPFVNNAKTLSGLNFEIVYSQENSAVQVGYYIPVLNRAFIKPYFGGMAVKRSYTEYYTKNNVQYPDVISYETEAESVGGEIGFSYSFTTPVGVIIPYVSADFGAISTNVGNDDEWIFNWGLHAGLGYVVFNLVGVNFDLGFASATENPVLTRFGFFITQDFLLSLFNIR